jgi:hypothetical protein
MAAAAACAQLLITPSATASGSDVWHCNTAAAKPLLQPDVPISMPNAHRVIHSEATNKLAD